MILLLVIAGIAGAGKKDEKADGAVASETATTKAKESTTTKAPTTTTTKAPTTTTTAAPTTTVPPETAGQRNARRSAENYLDLTAFSRSGLIKQLEFEGFSNEDAVYGVDHVAVDWNEQAAKSAANYLELTSFSRSGLVEQLLFEGFTQAEAEYGVSTTGL